ncbi:MAG TPA: protease inhibitor I42 family protein [Marmoricola sp.]|jgi:predicted secreted protein|nr:protease inhibitor I42 family protein [Marmoricola sp.]
MNNLRRTVAFAVIVPLASVGLLAAPSVADTPKTYHHAANGRTVTVHKGATIRIDLATSADGGYTWAIVEGKHSPKFKVVSNKLDFPSTPGVVGGTAHTVITLKATARGNATVKALERRSFDKSDVIARFTLHLHVVKPAK